MKRCVTCGIVQSPLNSSRLKKYGEYIYFSRCNGCIAAPKTEPVFDTCVECRVKLTVYNKSHESTLCKTCLSIVSTCFKCSTKLTMEDKHKSTADNNYRCLRCHNKELARIAKSEYRKKNADKERSRYLLNQSVLSGTTIKSNLCEWCGREGYVEGHHHSYCDFYALDIIWVCKKCHGKIHKLK